MAKSSVRDSIRITAPISVVWDAVCDLPGMGRFSLENTGGRWMAPHDGPQVGARFKGANRHGKSSWTTTATVTLCEEKKRFEFKVTYFAIPISTWSYELESDGHVVTLTESWEDRRPAWFALISSPIRADRRGFTEKSIRHTLEAIETWARGH